jgi:hypothetical protein
MYSDTFIHNTVIIPKQKKRPYNEIKEGKSAITILPLDLMMYSCIKLAKIGT